MQAAVNVIFNQIYATKGIKLFGERSIADMMKEFKQLYEGAIPGKSLVVQLNPDELIDAENSQALEDVNIIKEK